MKKGESAILNAPDLSEYKFNKMFGLGDKEHNQKVIQSVQNSRSKKESSDIKLKLWEDFYGYEKIYNNLQDIF